MELTKQLKADGIAKGLCEQYQGLLERCDNTEKMVRLFFRGIDFCIKELCFGGRFYYSYSIWFREGFYYC